MAARRRRHDVGQTQEETAPCTPIDTTRAEPARPAGRPGSCSCAAPGFEYAAALRSADTKAREPAHGSRHLEDSPLIMRRPARSARSWHCPSCPPRPVVALNSYQRIAKSALSCLMNIRRGCGYSVTCRLTTDNAMQSPEREAFPVAQFSASRTACCSGGGRADPADTRLVAGRTGTRATGFCHRRQRCRPPGARLLMVYGVFRFSFWVPVHGLPRWCAARRSGAAPTCRCSACCSVASCCSPPASPWIAES